MSEPTIDHGELPIARVGRWLAGPRAARGRLLQAWPRLLVLGVVGLVAAGQIAEDLGDSPPLQLLDPTSSVRRWTVIVAVLYLLVTSRFADGLVDRAVGALDRSVPLEALPPGHYADALRRPGALVDVVLLAASAVVVVVLFGAIGLSLPTDDPVTHTSMFLPSLGPSAVLILVQYALVGWAILSLVNCSIRRARALGRLSHEHLEINVFDTTNLLPLGNIALAASLAPAGIIVILLVGYGRPSQPLGWGVLLLATLASILALLLPLRGIHRQMARARYAALARLNAQLRELYDLVNAGGEVDMPESAIRNNKVAALTSLRTTVLQMTTWPFRDTLAFGRAVLIASAPLIYTIMSELIKAIWIKPLTGP